LRSVLDGLPGIELNGFVQPQDLPSMMASAGCLILPSQFEPWAVVIHEAAAAGLPVLASNRVGAAIHLVQPGFNGYLFDSWDSEGLATLMQWMTGMSEQRRQEMSQGSFYLSLQYSPRRWADTLLDGYAMAHGEISNQ
jgi:glycosyltransferase involved in cell wall biosynthesis